MDKFSRHDDEEEELEELSAIPETPMGMAADGLPIPVQLLPPPLVPARTPDIFVCLRGPCMHYWYLETMAGEGNPEGTFKTVMKKLHHGCLRNPGFETWYEDDNVYSCNQWDPLPPDQLVEREKRRQDYFSQLPRSVRARR